MVLLLEARGVQVATCGALALEGIALEGTALEGSRLEGRLQRALTLPRGEGVPVLVPARQIGGPGALQHTEEGHTGFVLASRRVTRSASRSA